jgi:hypothetical protein
MCVITVTMVMLLRDLEPYVFCLYFSWLIIIAVKEFWVLWDNIYDVCFVTRIIFSWRDASERSSGTFSSLIKTCVLLSIKTWTDFYYCRIFCIYCVYQN